MLQDKEKCKSFFEKMKKCYDPRSIIFINELLKACDNNPAVMIELLMKNK